MSNAQTGLVRRTLGPPVEGLDNGTIGFLTHHCNGCVSVVVNSVHTIRKNIVIDFLRRGSFHSRLSSLDLLSVFNRVLYLQILGYGIVSLVTM